MNQIVKAETTPTMSQATASASVLIALIVVLVGLGVLAALRVASVASVVFAIVIVLAALVVSPTLPSIIHTRARAYTGRANDAHPTPASVTPQRCHAFSLLS